MLCCFQINLLVPLMRWTPPTHKKQGWFEASVGPTAVLSGPKHCWAHSRSSVKYSMAVWEGHTGTAHGLHQYLSSFCHLGISQHLLFRGSSEPHTCLEGQQEGSCPGLCLDPQTFPRFRSTLDQIQMCPVGGEKWESLVDRFRMWKVSLSALRAQRRSTCLQRGLRGADTWSELLKMYF